MSQDVDDNSNQDGRKGNSVPAQLCPRPSRSRTSSNGPFLSKIRSFNHLALNSIGSLFSAQPLSKHPSSTRKGFAEYAGHLDPASKLKEEQPKFHDGSEFPGEDPDLTPLAGDYQEFSEDYLSVKPLPQPRYREPSELLPASELTDASHAEAHISTRLPEFRRFFGNLSRSRGHITHAESGKAKFGLYDPTSSGSDCKSSTTSSSLASNATSFSSPSCNGSFSSAYSHGQWVTSPGPAETELDPSVPKTPPLTPDSLNARTLPSIRLSLECSGHLPSAYNLNACESPEDMSASLARQEKGEDGYGADLYRSSNLWEVREGKKPERLSEITLDAACLLTSEAAGPSDSAVVEEDQDEWYGLEYTLEISSMERRPSETQSFSAGEHSKSRESWAAIHRGRIHPSFEDEDYHQWTNWHRFLDLQDERKKHKKGLEFEAQSRDLAWFFVDEIRTRDILYWQKEVYGLVARDVKERLQYVTEHRPDPFFPPRKHDYGWYLKPSRSLASLQEMKPREFGTGFE